MLIYLQMIETPEDRMKFQDIYETFFGFMYHIAHKILRNRPDTEDAVHQAFVSIAENIKKISSFSRPEMEAYIVVIVRNKAIDILRVKKHYVDQIDFDENMWGIDVIEESPIDLATLFGRLAPRYREILLLHYDIGFTTKEIARILKITPVNAEKLLWRAKRALQDLIEEEADHAVN